MKIKPCRLSKQLDSVTENPFVFCGYKVSHVIGQNTHSRNIFSVHGFLNLSVIFFLTESTWSDLSLKVTPDLHGCPLGKIRMHAILKENTANYISLESLINVDFGKNINKLPIFSIPQTTTKMNMCHSIELIGYQIQAHWQNNCTVLITKDQSSKVCRHFSI